MRRRQVLAVLGTTVPFAGCLNTATGSGSPTDSSASTEGSDIDITEPAVSQGETATVTIDAQSVTHLRFSTVPEIDATVEYENTEFSPSPSTVWQRRPPTWQWASAETITGDVPIHVPGTVPADEYQYAIAVQQSDHDEERVREFTLTVRE